MRFFSASTGCDGIQSGELGVWKGSTLELFWCLAYGHVDDQRPTQKQDKVTIYNIFLCSEPTCLRHTLAYWSWLVLECQRRQTIGLVGEKSGIHKWRASNKARDNNHLHKGAYWRDKPLFMKDSHVGSTSLFDNEAWGANIGLFGICKQYSWFVVFFNWGRIQSLLRACWLVCSSWEDMQDMKLNAIMWHLTKFNEWGGGHHERLCNIMLGGCSSWQACVERTCKTWSKKCNDVCQLGLHGIDTIEWCWSWLWSLKGCWPVLEITGTFEYVEPCLGTTHSSEFWPQSIWSW